MASTYSDTKLQLMATGENNTTWGNVTNLNLVALQELATGSADVTFASADVTLTLTSTNASQTARNARLNLTGTTGGARNLILGSGCQIFKSYIINNGTADTVTIKNTTGTGVAVPAGRTMMVFNNGANVVDVITHLSSLTVAGNSTLTGTLLVSGAANLSSTLNVTGAATLASTLNVAGVATFTNNVTISRNSATAVVSVVGDGQNAQANATAYGTSVAPTVGFYRARGSFAAPSAVTSGDALGTAAFYGRDSASADVVGASIRAGVNGAVASGIVPTRLIFATMPTTGTLTDRMVITEGGLITVNNSAGLGQVNIRAASGAQAIVLDNPSSTETLSFSSRVSVGISQIVASNALLSIATNTAHDMQWVTNNTIRYTISSAGIHSINGAGTSGVLNVRATSGSAAIVLDNPTASERLHFTPRASAGVARIDAQNSILQVGTSDANDLQFLTSGTYRGGISADGLTVLFTGVANSTSGSAANVYVDSATGRLYRSTSSKRYKDVIGPYVPPASIDVLEPIFFREKDKPGSHVFAGLLAEQVAAAGFEEYVVRDAKNQPDALHYSYMAALFVYEIKQLRQRVAALEGN